MAFYKAGVGGLPQGILANGKIILLGADDTLGAVLPGPTDGAEVPGDGKISVGGATTAGTSGRILTNFGFPVVADLAQSAAGTAYNTSTAPTNVEGALVGLTGIYPSSSAQAAGTLAPGRLNLVGRTLRVRASGIVANTATPNLTIAILLGTTVVATTGVTATVAITGTSQWWLEADLTCRAVGASGTLFSSGLFRYFTTGPTALAFWRVANTTPFTADTVDLTVAQALHIQATWGTNSASNTLTTHQLTAEVVGY